MTRGGRFRISLAAQRACVHCSIIVGATIPVQLRPRAVCCIDNRWSAKISNVQVDTTCKTTDGKVVVDHQVFLPFNASMFDAFVLFWQ